MSIFLLVDDDPDHRELIERELRERLPHAKVTATCDGNEIVELAVKLHPAAILLDIDLGPLSPTGWAINARLKQDQELARIPVLALTAHAYGSIDAEAARREGFAEHFPKPINWDRLVQYLSQFCKAPESCS